ncbi:hypothetical protein WK71_20505 [Burkholderia ubonensis]|nr:hypothetical protein WK71_20505 [Burkholderia ubonensis]
MYIPKSLYGTIISRFPINFQLNRSSEPLNMLVSSIKYWFSNPIKGASCVYAGMRLTRRCPGKW